MGNGRASLANGGRWKRLQLRAMAESAQSISPDGKWVILCAGPRQKPAITWKVRDEGESRPRADYPGTMRLTRRTVNDRRFFSDEQGANAIWCPPRSGGQPCDSSILRVSVCWVRGRRTPKLSQIGAPPSSNIWFQSRRGPRAAAQYFSMTTSFD